MLEIIAAIVVLAAVILMWVCLYDTHRFVITRKRFCSPKIQREQRFVMLSDLHGKQYGRDNAVLLGAIHDLKPDGILIVGDMLTAGRRTKIEPVISLLRKLCEKYPVYYANGNHEHKMLLHAEDYGEVPEKYFSALQETGAMQLVNQWALPEDCGIRIYGAQIDRRFFRRGKVTAMDEGYMDKLLGGADPDTYNILLAHNPDYFPAYARWGADLVLAGHVHGGIMRLPFLGGVISPALKLFPKYDGGQFEEEGSVMVLGRGLGTHAPDVRFFNPGELVVLDLCPQDVPGKDDMQGMGNQK